MRTKQQATNKATTLRRQLKSFAGVSEVQQRTHAGGMRSWIWVGGDIKEDRVEDLCSLLKSKGWRSNQYWIKSGCQDKPVTSFNVAITFAD